MTDRPWRRLVTGAVVAWLLASCGDKTAPAGGSASAAVAGCPPLGVKVDGVPLEGWRGGFAVTKGEFAMVQIFNNDKRTCAEMIAGTWSPADGERNVRAAVKSPFGDSVGLEYHTQMGAKLALVDRAQKDGDTMRICAEEIAFTPAAGAYEGKKVTIAGLFEGRYCGDQGK